MSEPEFFTTIAPDQVRPFMPPVRMMTTATGYWRLGQTRGKYRASGEILPVTLPDHVPEVAADSGGFEAARRHAGKYPFSFEAYLQWLAGIPKLTWAALPDLPVERELAGSFASVRARQELTLEWARELWGESTEHYAWNAVPWCWVPTIQGWDVSDYVWMAEQFGPLLVDQAADYGYTAYALDPYDDAGEDMWMPEAMHAEAVGGARNYRIGIGSLCKRQDMQKVVAIVRAVSEVLPGERFHLWGVKLDAIAALQQAELLDRVRSLDSAAWNNRFGRDLEAPKLSRMTQREFCWKVAWPAYRAKLDAAFARPFQPSLL